MSCFSATGLIIAWAFISGLDFECGTLVLQFNKWAISYLELLQVGLFVTLLTLDKLVEGVM